MMSVLESVLTLERQISHSIVTRLHVNNQMSAETLAYQ
jgi:hypothetical protein